jgi:uncharacterized protein YcbX
MRVHLDRIVVYPIKSLDGVVVEEAGITSGGILENDRIYSIADAQGKYVNGKRFARVHRLRSRFDATFSEVVFSEQDSSIEAQFVLAETEPINRWLGEFFGFAVTLKREPVSGFPDDREAFGPTVVSQSSMLTVANWYPGLSLESVRRRFRSNLELDGVGMPPFWEDQLFNGPGELKPFHIGAVQFLGHNPCQRCAVPTRDPQTGEVLTGFQKEFMERRRQALPSWANSTRFNHFYRFAVNTSIPPTEFGKRLRRGDEVQIPVRAETAS